LLPKPRLFAPGRGLGLFSMAYSHIPVWGAPFPQAGTVLRSRAPPPRMQGHPEGLLSTGVVCFPQLSQDPTKEREPCRLKSSENPLGRAGRKID
jgi:hypothetical protein